MLSFAKLVRNLCGHIPVLDTSPRTEARVSVKYIYFKNLRALRTLLSAGRKSLPPRAQPFVVYYFKELR